MISTSHNKYIQTLKINQFIFKILQLQSHIWTNQMWLERKSKFGKEKETNIGGRSKVMPFLLGLFET